MKAVKLWNALPVLEELSRVGVGYTTAKQVVAWVKLARATKAEAQNGFDALVKQYGAAELGAGKLRFKTEKTRAAFSDAWGAIENRQVEELPEQIDLRGELGGLRISAAALEALEGMIITEGTGDDGAAKDEV